MHSGGEKKDTKMAAASASQTEQLFQAVFFF